MMTLVFPRFRASVGMLITGKRKNSSKDRVWLVVSQAHRSLPSGFGEPRTKAPSTFPPLVGAEST